jgi:hypothetical protein
MNEIAPPPKIWGFLKQLPPPKKTSPLKNPTSQKNYAATTQQQTENTSMQTTKLRRIDFIYK